VLLELVVVDAALELLVGQEVVVDALDLAGSPRPGRRRDGDAGEAVVQLQDPADERSLACSRGTGDDEDAGDGG
jgi:hypothetical protein